METLLVKIFAAGLALSQVTRRLQDARRGLERAEEVFPSEALGRPARSLQRYSPPCAVPVGGHQRPAIRGTGVAEYLTPSAVQSALMPANLTTLPHFSVSLAISRPKSAGVIGIGVPPKSSSRAFIFGSTRAPLVSLLSFSTMSAGVFLGAPMPYQPLAS